MISPFLDKNIPAWHFSKMSLPDKWVVLEELREKHMYLSKDLNKRELVQRQEALWGSLEILYLNCFSTPRQGLLYSSGAEHRDCGSGVT